MVEDQLLLRNYSSRERRFEIATSLQTCFKRRMRPIIAKIFLINSAFVTSNLDHDFWEFHGGSRRRFKHGLNLATSSDAPQKDDCNVRFDKHIEIKPDLLVTNDEAQAAPAQISSDRVRSKEDLLLLPDRYSVLSFDSNQKNPRFVTDSIQYFRAHFGSPAPNRRTVKLKLVQDEEKRAGVAGFQDINQRLQHTSLQTASVNEIKSKCLDEISTMVQTIAHTLESKRQELEPKVSISFMILIGSLEPFIFLIDLD